jgi:hypothetical protein
MIQSSVVLWVVSESFIPDELSFIPEYKNYNIVICQFKTSINILGLFQTEKMNSIRCHKKTLPSLAAWEGFLETYTYCRNQEFDNFIMRICLIIRSLLIAKSLNPSLLIMKVQSYVNKYVVLNFSFEKNQISP